MRGRKDELRNGDLLVDKVDDLLVRGRVGHARGQVDELEVDVARQHAQFRIDALLERGHLLLILISSARLATRYGEALTRSLPHASHTPTRCSTPIVRASSPAMRSLSTLSHSSPLPTCASSATTRGNSRCSICTCSCGNSDWYSLSRQTRNFSDETNESGAGGSEPRTSSRSRGEPA